MGISQQLHLAKAYKPTSQKSYLKKREKERTQALAIYSVKHTHTHPKQQKSETEENKKNHPATKLSNFQNAVTLCSTAGQEDGYKQSPGGSGWLPGS